MMSDWRRYLDCLAKRTCTYCEVPARNVAPANRATHCREPIWVERDDQRAGGPIVQAMDKAAFEWLLASFCSFRINRRDSIHYSIFVMGIQWIAGSQSWLVNDQNGFVVVEDFDFQIRIWLQYRSFRRLTNAHSVGCGNDRTFPNQIAIYRDVPILDHFPRPPARR